MPDRLVSGLLWGVGVRSGLSGTCPARDSRAGVVASTRPWGSLPPGSLVLGGRRRDVDRVRATRTTSRTPQTSAWEDPAREVGHPEVKFDRQKQPARISVDVWLPDVFNHRDANR
jgi:hypothetical protein